jgi:magnesium transporter
MIDSPSSPLDYGVSRDVFKHIQAALSENDGDLVRYIINPLHPADVADIIEDLPASERRRFIEVVRGVLDPEVLAELEDNVREQVLDQLSAEELAAAITDLESDDAAFILDDLNDEQQRQILEVIPVEDRLPLEQTLSYGEHTAGRLMQREVVMAPLDWTLGQVIHSLEKHTNLPENFYEIFVVDENGVPKGSLSLSKILRYPRLTPVLEVMETDIKIVPVTMDQEEVAYLFRQYRLYSAPVVESDGVLMGMITLDDVVNVIEEEAGADILNMGGVSEENYHSTLTETCVSRLRWLVVTSINCLIASSVISHFESALANHLVLAFLMPIVASMGGNAGMQVVTVTVRALSTHHLKDGQLWGVLHREMAVALLVGTVLAMTLASITIAWFGNWTVGAILGGALLANILWSGFAGTMIPYILNRLRMDPAISAGPLLTTTTDVLGFALFLGLATLFLL